MATISVLAGCGSSDTTEADRVAVTVEDMQADLTDGDLGAVCAHLTRRASQQIGTVGHGRKATTCAPDLAAYLRDMRKYQEFDLRRQARPEVVKVAVGRAGKAASATMSFGGDPFTVPLVKEGDTWKVDNYFGARGQPPRGLQ